MAPAVQEHPGAAASTCIGGTDVANGNGRDDASDEDTEELPPGLAAWFAIEACVGETLDALQVLDSETDRVIEFVSGIHQAVKTWLTLELWAALVDAGQYTPDSLLASVLEHGVDIQQLPRSSPATPPRPGQDIEWRAFEGGDDGG
jgi:hypothetical protein